MTLSSQVREFAGRVIPLRLTKIVPSKSCQSVDKSLPDTQLCTPLQHTQFRSLLGSLTWLQSRSQLHVAYNFSRVASAAAAPTIGDMRALNKVARTIRATPQRLAFWPLKGELRIIGYPDASFRNKDDKPSQRGQVIFLAEPRNRTGGLHGGRTGGTPVGGRTGGQASEHHGRGSLVDYE